MIADKHGISKPEGDSLIFEFPYDAAFKCTSNQKLYVFIGEKYYRVSGDRVEKGYPKKIQQGWPGIPPYVDAAFEGPEKDKIYFFKGDQYWRYTKSSETVDTGYPKTIQDWEGKAISQPPIPQLGQQLPLLVMFPEGNPHPCPVPVQPPTSSTSCESPKPWLMHDLFPSGPTPCCPHMFHPPTICSTIMGRPSTLTEQDVSDIDKFMFGCSDSNCWETSEESSSSVSPTISPSKQKLPRSRQDDSDRETAVETSLMTNFF